MRCVAVSAGRPRQQKPANGCASGCATGAHVSRLHRSCSSSEAVRGRASGSRSAEASIASYPPGCNSSASAQSPSPQPQPDCCSSASAQPSVPRSRRSQLPRTGARSINKENQPGEPIGVTRAKQWSPEVEDAFRLSEAGWKGVPELHAFGLQEPERWPETGFIRKLQTRHSAEHGGFVQVYFARKPECASRHIHRVKIYRWA